jgi:hypothetical protein
MKKTPGAWPGFLWDKVGNEWAAYLYAASSVSSKEETRVTNSGRRRCHGLWKRRCPFLCYFAVEEALVQRVNAEMIAFMPGAEAGRLASTASAADEKAAAPLTVFVPETPPPLLCEILYALYLFCICRGTVLSKIASGQTCGGLARSAHYIDNNASCRPP